MDILRNLFFAYVATVVAFTTPLLPTSLRAKVKVPMGNDLRNVSATASESATMVNGHFLDDPMLIGDAGRVIIDDGALIGRLPPVVVSITPTPTPCVDAFPQQVANSNQLVPCANPVPSTPTSTPTPPPGCYYEQMNCVQGGPVGSTPTSCPAKLICKATGAPVPSEVPPGCYAMQICDEFPIGDVQPMWASDGLVQGQSGPFVGPKCRTEVICGKGTPTTVPSKTPTPLPSATMPTATLTPTPMAVCDYAAPPAGCAYIKGPKFNTVTQCGMELKCTGALVPTSTPTPPPGCYYEQMNCTQGGPVGSTPTSCPAKLICKATGAPVPTLPLGCKYVEACKPGPYDQGDWRLREITIDAAKSRITSGNSCFTSVQCIEPTKVQQPTPTPPANGCFTIDVCYGQDAPTVDRTWQSGFLPESGVPICKQQVICPSPTAKPLPTATPVKATPIPSPQASCVPSVGVCGYNLNSAWAGASDINCYVPNSGKHGDVVTLAKYPSVCMGGNDTGTYKGAGQGQAQVKCENGKWKTFHPYYFWTHPSWTGCSTPVTSTLGSATPTAAPVSTKIPPTPTESVVSISLNQNSKQCEVSPWQKAGHKSPDAWLKANGIQFIKVWEKQNGIVMTVCGAPLSKTTMVDVIPSQKDAVEKMLAKLISITTMPPKPPIVITLPVPVTTIKATPTPPPGCYYEQMNCVQGGPVGSTPTSCPAKLVCPPTKTPLPTAKPTVTLTPTITPTPVVLCSYASPPPGCVYVKGPKFNAVTQCGMELKCTGALIPTSTLTQVPKPTILISRLPVVTRAPTVVLKPTVVISPLPVFTITPTPTPNLEMKKLQDQVDALNKKLDVQSKELAQTSSLLKRMTDYLSKFFKF